MGTGTFWLDSQYSLQAPWATSFMASTRKSGYMNSTMGRRPIQAMPTAMPVKPFSSRGMSMTRSGKVWNREYILLMAPPKTPTSSPM